MFGKTYGKLTHFASNHDSKMPISPEKLYQSTIKESFVNQAELQKNLKDPSRVENFTNSVNIIFVSILLRIL